LSSDPPIVCNIPTSRLWDWPPPVATFCNCFPVELVWRFCICMLEVLTVWGLLFIGIERECYVCLWWMAADTRILDEEGSVWDYTHNNWWWWQPWRSCPEVLAFSNCTHLFNVLQWARWFVSENLGGKNLVPVKEYDGSLFDQLWIQTAG
jgi:hypothetical protein